MAYVAINISALEFCQLFNAIFHVTTKRQTNICNERTMEPVNNDNVLFPFLLTGCAFLILLAYFVVIPAISFVLPCFTNPCYLFG